jgi:hypothetical protein
MSGLWLSHSRQSTLSYFLVTAPASECVQVPPRQALGLPAAGPLGAPTTLCPWQPHETCGVLELHPYFLPLGFVGGAPMGAGPFLPLPFPLALVLDGADLAAAFAAVNRPLPSKRCLNAGAGGAAANIVATGSAAGTRLRRNCDRDCDGPRLRLSSPAE